MNPEGGVIRGLAATVGADAVLRRMGMGSSGAGTTATLEALVARGIGEGARLAAPAAVRVTLDVGRCAGGVVEFRETPFLIRSTQVAVLLGPCRRATLIGATVGPGLSSAARRLMDEKRMTEAMILDAYGSEAVEAVVEAVVRLLGAAAAHRGFALTRRFSPGYGDWGLEAQPAVLAALNAGRIGISAGPTHVLVPEKSVTAVVGWRPAGSNVE